MINIYHSPLFCLLKKKGMAELEKRWELEVEDQATQRLEAAQSEGSGERDTACPGTSNMSNNSGGGGLREPEPPFFHDYHLQELRQKELALLAFLRDVPMDTEDMETTTKSLL